MERSSDHQRMEPHSRLERNTGALLPDASGPAPASLRLIVLILLAAACVIGGTVLFSASRIGAKVIASEVFEAVIAGVAIIVVLAQCFLVPLYFRRVVATLGTLPSEAAVFRLFAAETLTRAGMLLGTVFVLYIVYLLTTGFIIMLTAYFVVLSMLALFPSAGRFARWRRAAVR